MTNETEYSFTPAAPGWCFVSFDAAGNVDVGFRVVMWRADAAGNVVGMVPVTVPSDFKPGTDRLSLATVPPIPGQYRHWDDLPEPAKEQIRRG
ncbi:hypothetical protein ACE15N_22740 (plasmid) [Xanthomonas campestris pv. passiflorae]|uniref:hypothetical protein n=1 Tax=Xanthomonas TaxID=338 RepID=UPI00031174D2|nr:MULTISPECIES: hypothetical protein [Xanthomonas]MBV6816227.1 hypothetical protein [Xanthomonas campestris pv. passiflorae]MDN0293096.1 hypothetical protein [Xanthomonas arboricola pv. pruni]NEK70010.1 hypothetical protein [Xanthomonas perforans]